MTRDKVSAMTCACEKYRGKDNNWEICMEVIKKGRPFSWHNCSIFGRLLIMAAMPKKITVAPVKLLRHPQAGV
jgi:hypothetical protein